MDNENGHNATPEGRTKPSPEWSAGNANDAQSDAEHASPDGASNDQRSPPLKRRREERERTRVSRACDRCKKKKTRCSGRCPCTLCLRSGLPCEFTASYTRGRLPSVQVDEAAMTIAAQRHQSGADQQLPLDDSRKESIPSSLPYPRLCLSSTTDGPIYSSVDKLNPSEDCAARGPQSRNSPEPTQGQRDQQGHYVGSSSAVSFLIRIQRRLHQNSAPSQDMSIFTFGDAPLPDFDSSFFVLPPKPDAQRLVERYFDFAAPTHRFLHRPSIEKYMEEFYETQGEMRGENEKAKAALLMTVFAQAQAYMPPGSTAQDNSARYFVAAEHQLSKERGAVRLASVQARLLQCFYLLTHSRVNHCWSLFGTMSHLAFAIGLHRGRKCDPAGGALDYIEVESRRRTFWCAYSLDKYLAIALGRPRTFKDEDIDQELPSVVNDSDIHTTHISPTISKSHSVMMGPVEHIKLSRIVSLVLRDLYSIRPPSLPLRIEFSAKYTSDLHAWRAPLSPFLADPADGGGIDSHWLVPIYQRQRAVLNLVYYHAMLLIHRPFLLRNFASLTHMPTHCSWGTNTTAFDTSANISSCLDAAIGIVRVVDDVFTSSNLFRSFWFTQYYAFCGVVVLYIYRIQQHLIAISPPQREDYFALAEKCQRQLESVSETDCLARRYCLVLEELRVEALRQTSRLSESATSIPTLSADTPLDTAGNGIASTNPNSNTNPLGPSQAQLNLGTTPLPTDLQTQTQPDSASLSPFYNNTNNNPNNIPPTPESTVFNPTGLLPSDGVMADLTNWGQFDSLVTAGIGMFDGGGWFGNDSGLGMGFGL